MGEILCDWEIALVAANVNNGTYYEQWSDVTTAATGPARFRWTSEKVPYPRQVGLSFDSKWTAMYRATCSGPAR